MMKRKIVFIGNSIVNGFPFKRSTCFVSLIREATKWDIINKGNNGETTVDILARFDKDVVSHAPDTVFIMTGTNDFIYAEASPEEAYENLIVMSQKAQAAGIEPVILTPLPVDAEMASMMWMAGAGIDYVAVNTMLEKLTSLIVSADIKHVDLNSAYKDCNLYHDGIHPLPEGHKFISDTIMDFILK